MKEALLNVKLLSIIILCVEQIFPLITKFSFSKDSKINFNTSIYKIKEEEQMKNQNLRR